MHPTTLNIKSHSPAGEIGEVSVCSNRGSRRSIVSIVMPVCRPPPTVARNAGAWQESALRMQDSTGTIDQQRNRAAFQ